jgi:hypothetical protein
MESLITRFFLYQWQRKLVALVVALVIWVFVSHSITSTITIPSVPLRVINLPADKTIIGLLPNGFLAKRATLTLSGTKDVIEHLEPGDIEVLLDVSNLPNEGIVQITKKNLVSLNPNINLSKYVTSVSHPEIMIKMSPLITEKIPIIIHQPIGESPNGYEYLDIWPMSLTQTVTGPQEEVLKLKEKGLDLTFNLNDLTKQQLDALQPVGSYDDELIYFVPEPWKKISIPFLTRGPEPINDPEAKFLQINFLKQQFIPFQPDIPVHVFYTLKYSDTINPNTFALAPNQFISMKNNIPILTTPFYANHVSRLFVEIVKDNIEFQIVTAPRTERERLQWDIGFIDDTHLEDAYVAYLLSTTKSNISNTQALIEERENHFRLRFREYKQRFALYLSPQNRLEIEASLEGNKIKVHVPNASLQPKPSTSNAN